MRVASIDFVSYGVHSRTWLLSVTYHLLEYQGGGCAICGVKEDQSYDHMPVDHCSETGKVRGILCSHCNRGIGLFEHNTDMMNDAIEYMKNPHAQDLWEYEEMPDSPPTLPID